MIQIFIVGQSGKRYPVSLGLIEDLPVGVEVEANEQVFGLDDSQIGMRPDGLVISSPHGGLNIKPVVNNTIIVRVEGVYNAKRSIRSIPDARAATGRRATG